MGSDHIQRTEVEKTGGFRWVICGLLFFSVATNYIDRLTIGILKAPLSEKLGWSEIDYGNIAAAFSFAYAFGYLVGGRLLDRFGVKRGLPVFVIVWSVAAMAHGLCGMMDVGAKFHLHYPWFSWANKAFIVATLTMPLTASGFMLARIVLGLSEGGNFPGAIKVVAEWFPAKERALATGLFNAGTNIGAILCPLLVDWIFIHWGWQVAFYITGGTGFFWVIAWWSLYDPPEKHPHVSAAELHYICEGQHPVEEQPPRVPLVVLLKNRAVWGILLSGMFAGPAWGFYQFFLPDFLKKSFHLTLTAMAWWTAAFYALAAIGGVAGGWLAGFLLDRGLSLNAARKLALLICALAVVPVCTAPFAHNVWVAVLILGLAGSAHQGWSANAYTLASDTMPKEAISTTVGLSGFLGYFTGGWINGITGLILQKTGSYVGVFIYFSLAYLAALVLLQLFIPKIELMTVTSRHPKQAVASAPIVAAGG
ncbi:MAG: MFS transporter [Phycisphaerae bacterium]|nr:MFS transporter [Phycisphaerae bacterium]